MDTFAYVNAAPQAALFNQGELLWLGLEDYILGHARAYAQRLSVFTAPILDPADPLYRGIQIPRRFWKIAAWTNTPQHPGDEPQLAATGYLLDQTPQLDRIDQTAAGRLPASEPPPLAEYLTYQVPILDLADLTDHDLGPLPAADRLALVTAARPTPWRQLRHLYDITF